MIDFRPFYQQIATTSLSAWLETLPLQLKQWEKSAHGDYAKWAKVVDFLPTFPAQINLIDKVEATLSQPLSEGKRSVLFIT